MKNNTRNKKVVILILFILVVIIQLVAFRLSKANNVIELNVSYIDEKSLLEAFDGKITATDKGSKGYLITLPETVNGLKVSKYYIEQIETSSKDYEKDKVSEEQINFANEEITTTNEKEILQDETKNNVQNDLQDKLANNVQNEEQNGTQNELEDKKEESVLTSKEPLEEVYISKKSIKQNSINIKVEYDTKILNNETLYNQSIDTTVNDVKITANGYMPKDAKLIALEVNTADIADTIKDSQKEKVNINFAYDIKIKVNEREYEPEEFGEFVQISINGIKIETKTQSKMIHIKEDNTVDEIKLIEKKTDEVTFKTDSFSVYALLSDITNTEESIAIGVLWDGKIATDFKYGKGTKDFPYLITSGEELAYLAKSVNEGESYESIYFQLTENLNLNSISWTPIGTIASPFKGIFDGAGYSISNVSIAITSSTNSVTSYGVFGAIGDGSSYSEIKNVEFNNVNIDLAVTRTIDNNTSGYKIGIVTGTMYNHSKIANVIVNNSSIYDSGTISFRYSYNTTYRPAVFIGGIAGDAVNTQNSETDPGDGARYKIENCYSNVDFDLDIVSTSNSYWNSNSSNMASFGQYNVGGIIGRIKSQPIWPESCLYTGSIDATNAFTGPIFGATVNNTAYASTSNYNTLWSGNDAGNLNMQSYYTSYSTNGSIFTSTVNSGTTPNSTTYRRSTSNSNIAYVQGVNKGEYLAQEEQMQSNFNKYASNEYCKWIYSNSKYSFNKKLVANIEETESGVFVVKATSQLQNPTYTYKWYVDGKEEVASEEDTINIPHELTKDRTAIVFVSDGESYVTVTLTVKKYTLYLEITYSENTKTLTAKYAGTYPETKFFDATRYTLQWYTTDLTDIDLNKNPIEGANSLKLTNVDSKLDYILIATNIDDDNFSVTGTYTNKNVVYVDYNNGKNANDGLTVDTPVKTFEEAYKKLDSNYEKERNIIVVTSNYEGTEFLNSRKFYIV